MVSLVEQRPIVPGHGPNDWHIDDIVLGPTGVTRSVVSLGIRWDDLPQRVQDFVEKRVNICQPDRVFLVDGSETQKLHLLGEHPGFRKLNKYHEVYGVHTDPKDVARVESKTFMSTFDKHRSVCRIPDASKGNLGLWRNPRDLSVHLEGLYKNCMKGQTLFVIPFSMGPINSGLSKYGIELTDSIYVTLCMTIMTRVGKAVLDKLGENKFVTCMHSVGKPNPPKKERGSQGAKVWDCNPEHTLITHYPELAEIYSFGSGYGGNSLLGKKCFALRIAMNLALDEGWLAEHMLIMGVTPPQDKGPKPTMYLTAAFPSACGKTNMAMLEPSLPGWNVTCVGDDIAWMRFNERHELRGINPESGFFGVAPGTSMHTNPQAMHVCKSNSVHTNVAFTSDGGVFWDGMEITDIFDAETCGNPAKLEKAKNDLILYTWLGGEIKYVEYLKKLENATSKAEKDDIKKSVAHPNSRFCCPASGCKIMDAKWEAEEGVHIEAIIFGGRRPTGIPLIYEAFNWTHGVMTGAQLKSESTAAAEHKGKVVMHDPMAMRPFIGYNFGEYLRHWLRKESEHDKKTLADGSVSKLPRIYHVNWFRLNDKGDFVWPGFGENIRVIDWVYRRVHGLVGAVDIPLGHIPLPPKGDDFSNSLDGAGLDHYNYDEAFGIDREQLKEDLEETKNWLKVQVHTDLPAEISVCLEQIYQNVLKMGHKGGKK